MRASKNWEKEEQQGAGESQVGLCCHLPEFSCIQ